LFLNLRSYDLVGSVTWIMPDTSDIDIYISYTCQKSNFEYSNWNKDIKSTYLDIDHLYSF